MSRCPSGSLYVNHGYLGRTASTPIGRTSWIRPQVTHWPSRSGCTGESTLSGFRKRLLGGCGPKSISMFTVSALHERQDCCDCRGETMIYDRRWRKQNAIGRRLLCITLGEPSELTLGCERCFDSSRQCPTMQGMRSIVLCESSGSRLGTAQQCRARCKQQCKAGY